MGQSLGSCFVLFDYIFNPVSLVLYLYLMSRGVREAVLHIAMVYELSNVVVHIYVIVYGLLLLNRENKEHRGSLS